MGFEIRDIKSEDERLAMRFAAKGMHLDRYAGEGLALRAYVRSFWYEEKDKATDCIAAYADGRLAGVMLASMDGEPRPYATPWRRLFVGVMSGLTKLVAHGEDAYDQANRLMLAKWRCHEHPDGEICFLAADPDHHVRGTGTALLAELERRYPGRLVYLYTDDACTWQFYEHRGFARVGEERISLDVPGSKEPVPMTCMLYAKRLGGSG